LIVLLSIIPMIVLHSWVSGRYNSFIAHAECPI
jgi:hypothetical protein